MNWKWPDEISVAEPSAVQLVNASVKLGETKTRFVLPEMFVNPNWNVPLADKTGFISEMGGSIASTTKLETESDDVATPVE